jgi:preprotein translocase subunit SecE
MWRAYASQGKQIGEIIMAKKAEIKKQNKAMEILTKEYPFEKTLLAILGLMVIVVGVYVLEDRYVHFNDDVFGILDEQWKISIFAWFVIVIGAGAFLLAIWPFFVPSISEMKKVSWPTRNVMINHTLRVFGFILFLALFFLVLELGFSPLFARLRG